MVTDKISNNPRKKKVYEEEDSKSLSEYNALLAKYRATNKRNEMRRKLEYTRCATKTFEHINCFEVVRYLDMALCYKDFIKSEYELTKVAYQFYLYDIGVRERPPFDKYYKKNKPISY